MFILVGSTQCLWGDKHLKEFWRQSNQFSLLITETQAQKYNIIHDQKFWASQGNLSSDQSSEIWVVDCWGQTSISWSQCVVWVAAYHLLKQGRDYLEITVWGYPLVSRRTWNKSFNIENKLVERQQTIEMRKNWVNTIDPKNGDSMVKEWQFVI